MEQDLIIEVADDYQARAKRNEISPDAPVVLFMHGLGGKPWESDERRVDNDEFGEGFSDLAAAFAAAGYSTFRLHLYEPRTSETLRVRTWRQITLETFAADLDAVVAFLKDENPSRPVIAIGHSYGAVAILMSPKMQFDAAMLYDPAALTDERRKPENWTWDDSEQLFRYGPEGHRVATKDRLEAERKINLTHLMESFPHPFELVLAGATNFSMLHAGHYDDAKVARRMITIDDAPHDFTGFRHLLARETLEWLQLLGYKEHLEPFGSKRRTDM